MTRSKKEKTPIELNKMKKKAINKQGTSRGNTSPYGIKSSAKRGQTSSQKSVGTEKKLHSSTGSSYYKKSNTPRSSSNKQAKRATNTKNSNLRKTVSSPTIPEQRREQLKKKNKLTKNQILKNKKRKQRRFILRVVVAMCITTFVVWGGLEVKTFLTKPKVSYQTVKTGTMDNSIELEGMVLRNEKVYYGKNEGMLRYTLSEGEKVQKDGVVYVMTDEEHLSQVTQEKEEIDSALYNAAENRQDISYYQDQIYKLDKQIDEQMSQFYRSRYENTTHYVYTLREQLDSNVAGRSKIYQEEQGNINGEIAEQVQAINLDLNKYQTKGISPQPGIISYKIDGQETELDASFLGTLDYEKYMDMIKKSNKTTLKESYVTKESPLYKIVLDDKWYIVSYIDDEHSEYFVEGNTYYLQFEGLENGAIAFKLSSKVEEGKRIKLIFETNDRIKDFLEERQISFSIGNKRESGLKIPLQAIVEKYMLKIPNEFIVQKDNEDGVYRKVGEVLEFIPLKVEYIKEDIAYILQDITNGKMIQLNDIIVSEDSKTSHQVKEIESQQGVYVINGKIAQFKAVEIYLQGKEYALIKENGKSEIKEKDKIISNPKSIKIDQLLDDMSIQNE